MNIKYVGTPNYSKGRSGFKPKAIVNHITAGAYPGCLDWMQNPKAQASSNYLITGKGEILQLVKDEDMAWANGRLNGGSWKLYNGKNPNLYTISIEHEGYGSHGGDGKLTPEQFEASVQLHLHLMKKWNIPLSEDHIIGHYKLDPVNRPCCPGRNFPWKELFERLEEETMEVKDLKIEIDGKMITVKAVMHKDLNYVNFRDLVTALGKTPDYDPVRKMPVVR